MTIDKLEGLEEKIEKPGYLLLLVFILLFLIIGFVNLIDHTSGNTTILNKYSIGHVVLMGLYLGIILLWASRLFKPNDDSWLTGMIDWLQQRPFLSLGLFAFFGLTIYDIFTRDNWLNFPALQAVILVFILTFSAFLLATNWGIDDRPTWWRKLIVYPLAGLLLVELVLQALTFAGVPPSLTTAKNSFIPFGRIYQTEEGLTNTVANSNGWYYPEFSFSDESKRVLLIGDKSVQAIQIKKEQNMGWLLHQAQIDQTAGETIEFLSLGYPDHGPGLYLDPTMLDYAIEAYQPDEIIVVFDFNNDFQIIERPQRGALYYEVAEDGSVEIHANSFGVRHQFQHLVLRAYEGFQPNRFITTHYLTPRVASLLLNPPSVSASEDGRAANDALGLPNSFVFNAATNDTAVAVAAGIIQTANQHLASQGITLKVVTLPVFPDPFYAQYQGPDWKSTVGNSDLFLPEAELETFAIENGIPFLAMGTFMQDSGLTTDQIQALYFGSGGQITPAGHELYARAIKDCFFSNTPMASCSTP